MREAGRVIFRWADLPEGARFRVGGSPGFVAGRGFSRGLRWPGGSLWLAGHGCPGLATCVSADAVSGSPVSGWTVRAGRFGQPGLGQPRSQTGQFGQPGLGQPGLGQPGLGLDGSAWGRASVRLWPPGCQPRSRRASRGSSAAAAESSQAPPRCLDASAPRLPRRRCAQRRHAPDSCPGSTRTPSAARHQIPGQAAPSRAVRISRSAPCPPSPHNAAGPRSQSARYSAPPTVQTQAAPMKLPGFPTRVSRQARPANACHGSQLSNPVSCESARSTPPAAAQCRSSAER